MAIDVGNTQTVVGLFRGDGLQGRWRLATEAHRTADELGATCAAFLGLRGIELDEVEALIVSSVVPGLTRSYEHLAVEVMRVPFYSVGPQMETGLKNRYDDPGAVGADRIVNSVAAVHHYGAPVIIVDSGTATTVCAVDGDGAYRGGAILPGLYVSLETLVSRAAQLSDVDLEEEPPRAIATNTPDSIRSGFVYGYAGAVDALIRRFKEELAADGISPEELPVIATGGPASIVVRHCREIDEVDPDLTLKGLRLLYRINTGG
ncbi:MAG: type III pantothenate kinase [Actinomycetota bacterium]|nr:type III pantothenate kinase [Actinomycetota bacterium]